MILPSLNATLQHPQAEQLLKTMMLLKKLKIIWMLLKIAMP
jgi:hypothetical protein